ncbi:hypothetical protein HanIR_Chr05g0225651 [Helianthus annuus]|nr:hypothetical protein HanIR_Chr05g0225651 [Helianthus annuus]
MKLKKKKKSTAHFLKSPQPSEDAWIFSSLSLCHATTLLHMIKSYPRVGDGLNTHTKEIPSLPSMMFFNMYMSSFRWRVHLVQT